MRQYEAFFDGACWPNPNGHAACGAFVQRLDGERVFEHAEYLGNENTTNNLAEYAGLIAVLEFTRTLENSSEIHIYGDSDLVVKQLNGKWRARKGAYLSYYKEAVKLRAKLPEVEIRWIPREQNEHADYLSKQAINQPRSGEENRTIAKLVEAQRRDRYDPRFKVAASRPVKGAPF